MLLAAALPAGCAVSTPLVFTATDQATVAQAETYLDGLREFHARFTASGSEGDTDGILWLDRPGRLRVEYLHPPKLLVADHGRLLLEDESIGATTTMPVSNTPLDILLADKIALSGAVTVTSVQRQPGAFQIGLVKTAEPDQGRLTLQFDTTPLRLRSVVVQDRSGNINALKLYGLHYDSNTDPRLFDYQPPALPAG